MSKPKIHYDTGLLQSTPLNSYIITLCGRWVHIKDKVRTTKNHTEITCKQCYKKWLTLSNRNQNESN